MPEVVGEGEIVLSARNAEALAAFEQTERAGERSIARTEQASVRAEERKAVAVERSADRQIRAIDRVAAKQQQAATKAAGALSTFGARAKALQSNALVSELETVASMFTQVGGAVSQAGILASSAVRPVALLGSTLGATGLAAAAFPVAAGAAALGAKSMADSAVEARDRLKKLGQEVDSTASDKLDSYTAATRDLGIAIDTVKVAIGDDIAEELALFTRVVASGVDDLYRWGQAASEAADTATDWISFGIKPAWQMIGGALYESLTKTTRATVAAADAARKHADELKKATKAAADLNNQMEREAQEDEAAGKAERLRQETEAIRRAAEIEQEEAAESARRRAEALAMIDREIVAINERTEAMKSYIAALHAIDDIESQMAALSVGAEKAGAEIDAMIAGWEEKNEEVLAGQVPDTIAGIASASVDAALQVAGAMEDIFSQMSERAIEAAEELDEANEKLLERQRKIGAQIIALKREIAREDDKAAKKEKENRLRELEGKHSDLKAEREMNAELAEDKRKAALRAFNANKIAAATQIGIQTAVAMITALGPPLGPIAGAIAAGGIAAAGATAAGIVLSKKPPEFPMGMSAPRPSPDHTFIAALQPTERIVTSRGARDDDAVRRLNEGRGGPGEMTAHVYLGNKLVGAARGRERIRVDPRAGKAQRRRRR
jgi:hypothetical protein